MEKTKALPWDSTIKELEDFFSSNTLPKSCRMNAHTTIINVQMCIDSHMATVKKHNGEKAYYPYLERLIELKKCLSTHLIRQS